jgi:hypothetical protein
MFDIQINGLGSPLINLKIEKASKFDKVMRSTTKIHFRGLEKEEYRRFVFVFGCLGSRRKAMVEIILAWRSIA